VVDISLKPDVIVIGGGLAGSEAAWQAAMQGFKVLIYEMRPNQNTPAHYTDKLGELVCSNSLRARSLQNAVGLLKEELRILGSLIIECAHATEIPAGGALAVDRNNFAATITEKIEHHPLIQVKRDEIKELPEFRPLIIATGPLTSDDLAKNLYSITGEDYLYFFDAAAPIVSADSINYDVVFKGTRYDKGSPDYLNCPMDEKQYHKFWQELVDAEKYVPHQFEEESFFEGCMPVEEMAARGKDTLVFGPLKPVGLIDPRNGSQPYAVVQLRADNALATLYNMVGFQTRLKWPEQKRVFRMIPGLENAEFQRYGMMHRNTYINAPRLLSPSYELREHRGIFIAGQLSGVEGYVESTASGLVAGLNAAAYLKGASRIVIPPETALGALSNYISHAKPDNFQPMNVNFGMFPPLEKPINKKQKRELLAKRALNQLEVFRKKLQDYLA